MRPMGWLISVQSPGDGHRPLYATVANSHGSKQGFRCSTIAPSQIKRSGSKEF